LHANRFEVAVIGLEKAGKSALLNAWLGQEILPSATRKMYVHQYGNLSAQTEQDQLLFIQYYSKDEISKLQQQRKEALAGTLSDKERKKYKRILMTLKKNLNAIYEFTQAKKMALVKILLILVKLMNIYSLRFSKTGRSL